MFKVGDLVKGKENNYGITNEKMTLAKVIEVDLKNCRMTIKVLQHELYEDEIGEDFIVDNDVNEFELVCKESEKMSEIRVNANNITLTTASSDPFIKYEHWLSTPILRFGYLGENNLPKEYYINEKKKTVVLKWDDDTITKVKTSKDDKFNAKFGFLLAYFQKNCGMSRTQANKYIDNLKVEIEDKKVTKKKKEVK